MKKTKNHKKYAKLANDAMLAGAALMNPKRVAKLGKAKSKPHSAKVEQSKNPNPHEVAMAKALKTFGDAFLDFVEEIVKHSNGDPVTASALVGASVTHLLEEFYRVNVNAAVEAGM